MSTWVKTLVVVALVVPMAVYVLGSLIASGADRPADRGVVILRDDPMPSREPAGPDDRPRRSDDGEPRVLTPRPTTVDDDVRDLDDEDDDQNDDEDHTDGDGDPTGDE